MNNQFSSSSEWQTPLVALVGNTLEGKMRSLTLVPAANSPSPTSAQAHLLVGFPRLQANRDLFVHPYQLYEFQARHTNGLIQLSQAAAVQYRNWENWPDLCSFLGVDNYIREQRQALFFYRLLLSSVPVNLFIPLGALTYQLVQLTHQKGLRQFTTLDWLNLVENSCS